jgi:hypothetical protein
MALRQLANLSVAVALIVLILVSVLMSGLLLDQLLHWAFT